MVFTPEDGTGLSDANSFCTVDAADEVNAANPYASSWNDATEVPDKERFLMEATLWLNSLPYASGPVVETQALVAPFCELYTPYGIAISSTIVPQFLVRATARLAAWLRTQTDNPFESSGLAAGQPLKIGPLTMTIDVSTSRLPDDVMREVGPYLIRRAGSLSISRV